MNNTRRPSLNFIPPALTDDCFGQKVVCERPLRRSGPNISSEFLSHIEKTVFHNYGHGGAGWTLVFGAVNQSVSFFLESLQQDSSLRHAPITILGAGVMGLVTAYELEKLRRTQSELGIGPIKIVAEAFSGLASNNAGGLWAQVHVVHEFEHQPYIDRLSIESFQRYFSIACGEVVEFEGCAELQPYLVNKGFTSGIDCIINAGLLPPPVSIIADFGHVRHEVLLYQSLYINTALMMQRLRQQIDQWGISFEQRDIRDFSELPEPVIFNCAGLGAKALTHDPKLDPMVGHIISLKRQPFDFVDTEKTAPAWSQKQRQQWADRLVSLISPSILEQWSLVDQRQFHIFLGQFQGSDFENRSIVHKNYLFYFLARAIRASEAESALFQALINFYQDCFLSLKFSRYMCLCGGTFIERDRLGSPICDADGKPKAYEGKVLFVAVIESAVEHTALTGCQVGKLGITYIQSLDIDHDFEFQKVIFRAREFFYGKNEIFHDR